jgi:hypothetical protein
MEAGIRYGKTRWVEPAVAFLFFFNTFLLPQGISFTLLLTPVWIYLLDVDGRTQLLKYVIAAVLIYTPIHLWLGADGFYYAVSMIMLICISLFCIAIWPRLNDASIDYDYLFKRLLILNFLLTLLCLPFLLVPELKELVWYNRAMSDNMRVIPRLKMFTYEASHYSYLIAPLVIFYYSRALFGDTAKAMTALFMISLPLALSLSFGVIGCLLISGAIIVVVYFRRIFNTTKKRVILLSTLLGLIVLGLLLHRFFPENIFFVRFRNMLTGDDTSSRGRTYESFILAHKIIAQKSYLWGIGPGQIKLFGRNIIVQYYHYSKIPETIRIPNACAETIACFGYLGFLIRIAVQLLLFYTTRVFKSPFRLWLFLFLFIFQFTGSFITNVVEYVAWMLAFLPVLDRWWKRELA